MKLKAVSGIMLTLLLTSMLTLAFNIEPVSAGVYPAIYVDPATIENATLTPGKNFTVSIKTNYTGDDVWGYEFTLTYNPLVLQGARIPKTDTWTGDNVTKLFFTTNKIIVPGSEEVYVNQTLMTRGPGNYTIDYQTGKITFTTAPGEVEVKITYLYYGVTNGDLITGPLAMFISAGFDDTLGKLGRTSNGFFLRSSLTSGPGTLANVTFTVVGKGATNITLGPETKLIGRTPPNYYPYTITDHIQHGYFNNVQPIHDVAVVRLIAPATAFTAQLVSIKVIIANEGNYTESVIVKVSYDATEIGTESFTLASGLFKTLSFSWNTTDLAQGTYTITAEVILDGDADLTDNCATAIVVVSYPPTLISVPYHHQITSYYCGPASLEMVFDFHGPDISQLEIADAAMTYRPYGTTHSGMIRAAHFSNLSTSIGDEMPGNVTGYSARKLGYAAFHQVGFSLEELKSLIDSGYPIIVTTWFTEEKIYGHFRVVVGYNETHVILHDPWLSRGPMLNMTNSKFLDLWEYSYYSGLFVSPWNVDISAPQNVREGDIFTVTATVTYPCPTPFPTYFYPASLSNATIKLHKGMSLVSGENAKKLIGDISAGNSATVSWIVQVDSSGTYTIGIEAEGKITGHFDVYSYEDRIGGLGNVNVTVNPAATTVSIYPTTLNLRSEGRWITAYIELPEGYNVSDIDIYSIRLNDIFNVSLLVVPPVLVPTEIGDYDNDTIPDLMVKFNRTELTSHIYHTLDIKYGNVTLTITGNLTDGTTFEGSDTIRVMFGGDVNCDGKVDWKDLLALADAYNTKPEDPNWDPNCDLDHDNKIYYKDLFGLADNYGATVPPQPTN